MPTRERLKELYITERKTTQEIAEHYGTSATTVRRKLKEYRIPTRNPREAGLNGKKLPSKLELIELYVEKKNSTREIGKKYGVNTSTIDDLIRVNQISFRRKSKSLSMATRFASKEELEELYLNKEKSAGEISKYYSISESTVRRGLMIHNIPIRSVSEALLLLEKSSNGSF